MSNVPPIKPKAPAKTVSGLLIKKFEDYDSVSVESLLALGSEMGLEAKDILLSVEKEWENYGDDYYAKLSVYTNQEVPNPEYERQYKKYQKDLEKYKRDYKKYKEEKDKEEIQDLKAKIADLQNSEEKIKSYQEKLNKLQKKKKAAKNEK